MAYRSSTALRPEAALEGAGPRFGEYPVALMTRRNYSLWATDVVNRREAAPNAIWVDPRNLPDEAAERTG